MSGSPSDRRRIIALDTQVLLEFKHLNELTPEDLGVASPAEWLITRTVEREIDRKKRGGDRLQRRARQVDRLLDDTTLPIRRFRPSQLIDYSMYHLDPAHNDDKILAELIAFRNENPNADLYVVSDDGGFRRTARDLGFSVSAPPTELRLRPDPLEQENLELRDRIAELENARAKLDLRTQMRPLIALVCSPLDEAQLEAAVEGQTRAVAPHEDSEILKVIEATQIGVSGPRNPKYGEQRLACADQFREYYRDRYRIYRRCIEVDLHLSNDGNSAAEDIDIEIEVPPNVGVAHETMPKPPPLPPPPATHASLMADRLEALTRSPNPFVAAGSWRARNVGASPIDNGPHVINRAGGVALVRYRRSGLAQKRTIGLPPFFLVIGDNMLEGLELAYEIRSSAPGVVKGTLPIRLSVDSAPPPPTPIMREEDW